MANPFSGLFPAFGFANGQAGDHVLETWPTNVPDAVPPTDPQAGHAADVPTDPSAGHAATVDLSNLPDSVPPVVDLLTGQPNAALTPPTDGPDDHADAEHADADHPGHAFDWVV